jgi:hypothetical protein
MAMLDMAELICPGGSCLPFGVRPDGIHFTPAAGTWAVELMLPDLLALLNGPR